MWKMGRFQCQLQVLRGGCISALIFGEMSYVPPPPWILSVITQGYILPFMSAPPPYSRPNQPSAFAESEFVDSAIAELLLGGCIKMVAEQPVVCTVVHFQWW